MTIVYKYGMVAINRNVQIYELMENKYYTKYYNI